MAILDLLHLDVENPLSLALKAAGLLAGLGIGYGVFSLVQVRMMFRGLRKQGIPLMPHSFLLGHLPLLGKATSGKPGDLHPNYIPQLIVSNWKEYFPDEKVCPPAIYVDLWPIGPPVCFIIEPSLYTQAIWDTNLPKPYMAIRFMKTLCENRDLVSMEGQEWKRWRGLFNPGFSSRNMMDLVPAMVEEVATFRDVLKEKAGDKGGWGEVFLLTDATINLTLDVIGRAALDIKFGEQTQGRSAFFGAMQSTHKWILTDYNIYTIWTLLNPWRAYVINRNRRIMRNYLLPIILDRVNSDDAAVKKKKTVMDLAVQAFVRETGPTAGDYAMHWEFYETIISQLKIFLFAGHDTTATTMCWLFHDLARNPEVLKKVREELDQVFGPDVDAAVGIIKQTPHILNQIPYTTAVIRESMRMYSNFSTIRDGRDDFAFTVSGYDAPWPTGGFIVWDANRASYLWDDIWPRPKEFLPERWLVEQGHELYPPKNGLRTFSGGERYCIGQELAMNELKMAVVLTVREMDVECAWEEFDKIKGTKDKAKTTVDGDRLYQVDNGSGSVHVKEKMPVHVRLRQ